MAMVVSKKYRLLQKKDKNTYNPEGQKEELRSEMIIDEATVLESQQNCYDTGILFVIDEEATKARNSKLEKKDFKKEKPE